MPLLRRLLLEGSRLLALIARDSNEVPAICYAECNNAYIEAQSVGKTPALCEANSTFLQFVTSCNECTIEYSSNTTALQSYIQPQFQQYLTFCSASGPLNSSTVSSSLDASQLASQSSRNAYISSIQSVAESLGILNSTAVERTVYITTTSPTSATAPAVTSGAQVTSNTPSPTSASIPVPKPNNKTWIAGAVLGPVSAIVAAIAFLLVRRHRQQQIAREVSMEDMDKDKIAEKAQLHGDDLRRYELAAENENLMPELPALVGSELPGDDRRHSENI